MKLAIIAGSILALAGSAAAQPGMTPYAPPPPPPAPAPVPLEPQLSEGTALALSLGGTVGAWALAIGAASVADSSETAGSIGLLGGIGTLVAPSFGHWYAGTFFTRGMGLRLGGMGAMVVGFALVIDDLFSEGGDDGDASIAGVLMLTGFGLYIGGTIDDIVTAPTRVSRLNRERAGVAIAPMVTHQSAGLVLGGRF